MPLILPIFAACICCCFAELLVLDRVGKILAERHSPIWKEVSAQGLTPHYAIYRFAQARRDRGLGDPALTRLVERFRLLHGVLLALLAIYGVVLVTGLGARAA